MNRPELPGTAVSFKKGARNAVRSVPHTENEIYFRLFYFVECPERAQFYRIRNDHILDVRKAGFDCGFLYFRFKDEELNDLAKEVATYGLDKFCSDGTFILDIPYENQSTTIKRFEAQIIRDLLKENALPEISYKTVLD